MFNKILIANRGEIACRIIRTAEKMGIKTVALFSDADKEALHVEMADEAIHIGPSPPLQSYLDKEKIVTAAHLTGAEAIHPGYGFLSENTYFCRQCQKAGVVFIGPSPEAIEAMGSKSAAKKIMANAGVPLVPGYHETDQDPDVLKQAADTMGYPVLLKAVSGGGGKGMRTVWKPNDFFESLEAAKREALNSFGDATMLVEKFLVAPRHVEIQVFCDRHGHGVYLADRDCSIQRRHQKIVEEAPAPGLPEALRRQMGEAALRAAQAIDYVGAGTVEFLLASNNDDFYFMEMNTRLQVEHPVTEMVTGIDLVEWQLRIAWGDPLPLTQNDIQVQGHALETRIYAEDPANEFLPVSGTLTYLHTPEESPHVRVDSGVGQGDDISVHYDPMIAKLIVWDRNREAAVKRLSTALSSYHVAGVTTNIDYLRQIVDSEAFRKAEINTTFIETHPIHTDPEKDTTEAKRRLLFQLTALYITLKRAGGHPLPSTESDTVMTTRQRTTGIALPPRSHAAFTHSWPTAISPPPEYDNWICFHEKRRENDPGSPWNFSGGWRLNEPHMQHFDLEYLGERCRITVERVEKENRNLNGSDAQYRISDGQWEVNASGMIRKNLLIVLLDGHRFKVHLHGDRDGHGDGHHYTLFLGGRPHGVNQIPPDLGEGDALADKAGLTAPMTGTVVAVVAPLDTPVKAGDPLVVMEAMKMEHTIRAPQKGRVMGYFYKKGDLVNGGKELLHFEPEKTLPDD